MSHEKMEKKIKVNAPVTMGKEYELKIERMGSNAEGVSHVDGFAVFVKGALAGEVVVGKVTLVKKNYAVADVKKWLRKSADRVEPKAYRQAKKRRCFGDNRREKSVELSQQDDVPRRERQRQHSDWLLCAGHASHHRHEMLLYSE